jgi:hypothetical protein
MSRRMACSLTIDAVNDRTKTVTRRHVDSWRALRVGDRLTLIEKGMGLPKGAKQVVLAEVRIVAVNVEPLASVNADEVRREGLAPMRPIEFVLFWAKAHGYGRLSTFDQLEVRCRRIEWEYL